MKTLNKDGFSLVELLAYIAIVGMVLVLLTSTLSFVMRTYNRINVQGSVYSEANFAMSNVLSSVNGFDADYVEQCIDDKSNPIPNCVRLVKEDKVIIDPELGIISSEPDYKSITIKIENNNLYINNLQLNSDEFQINVNPKSPSVITNLSNTDKQAILTDEYSYIGVESCYDDNNEMKQYQCQKPVIMIKLSINKRNNDLVPIDPFKFINRIAF